jgi:hypothetical protein
VWKYAKIHTMSRAQTVARPLRDRTSTFLIQAYPGQQGRPFFDASGMEFDAEVPDAAVAATQLDYIRQLRNIKKRDCNPNPERAWDVGGALTRLSGKRWLNPVVLLFACGHYAEVAEIFTRVTIGQSILAEMARMLPRVVSEPGPDASIGDQLAFRESLKWEQGLPLADSYERRVWSIEGSTYAAFSAAWRSRGGPPPNGASTLLNGCALIAGHAEYPVAERDHHVSVLIVDWLTSRSQTGPAR